MSSPLTMGTAQPESGIVDEAEAEKRKQDQKLSLREELRREGFKEIAASEACREVYRWLIAAFPFDIKGPPGADERTDCWQKGTAEVTRILRDELTEVEPDLHKMIKADSLRRDT